MVGNKDPIEAAGLHQLSRQQPAPIFFGWKKYPHYVFSLHNSILYLLWRDWASLDVTTSVLLNLQLLSSVQLFLTKDFLSPLFQFNPQQLLNCCKFESFRRLPPLFSATRASLQTESFLAFQHPQLTSIWSVSLHFPEVLHCLFFVSICVNFWLNSQPFLDFPPPVFSVFLALDLLWAFIWRPLGELFHFKCVAMEKAGHFLVFQPSAALQSLQMRCFWFPAPIIHCQVLGIGLFYFGSLWLPVICCNSIACQPSQQLFLSCKRVPSFWAALIFFSQRCVILVGTTCDVCGEPPFLFPMFSL